MDLMDLAFGWPLSQVLCWNWFVWLKWKEESGLKRTESLGIDGMVIMDLSDEDLEKELRISSRIHRKKILNGSFPFHLSTPWKLWHSRGLFVLLLVKLFEGDTGIQELKQFDLFMKSQVSSILPKEIQSQANPESKKTEMEIEEKIGQPALPKKEEDAFSKVLNVFEVESIASDFVKATSEEMESEEKPIDRLKTAENVISREAAQGAILEEEKNNRANLAEDFEEPKKRNFKKGEPNEQKAKELRPKPVQSSNEIMLRQIEGANPSSIYSIKEEGGKIGRHSSNNVVILEESVSRFHSEIHFQENNFYLLDVGSTTGTYLKIQQPLKLQEGTLVEMGSYQFFVQKISINLLNPSESFLALTIYEGPCELTEAEIIIKESAKIGRKTTNQISFQDDIHMSNMHAQINLINGAYMLEDIASTNGYIVPCFLPLKILLSFEQIVGKAEC